MTELAKHIAQQIAEYCCRGTPERLEEIIDSAGVRELTAQLEQTLVIARQALVYFNTESGRAAMKELEKIEARIKGAAKETRLLGMNETELANIEHSERGATDAENGRKDLPSALTPYHGGENG